MKSALGALLAAALYVAPCFPSDKPSEREGAELLAKAVSLQNIREQGAQPFQLRMRIHSDHLSDKPLDIAYAEVWMGPSKWRREIAFPGFSQLETGDIDSEWLARNLDFKPRSVSLAQIAIEYFVRPGGSNPIVKSARRQKKNGAELRCAEFVDKEDKTPRELCFDGSGAMVSETHANQRFEYGDFGKFGSKIFPKSIQVYESKHRLLDISADDLSAPSDVQDPLFQHGPGAHQLAACEQMPKLIKKVPPQYPPAARQRHEEGTVILYGLLSSTGEVEKTIVLQSAGALLDDSARVAVQQWTYSPPICAGHPLAVEVETQVNFALRYE